MTTVRVELTAPQFTAYNYLRPRSTITLAFGRGGGKSWFVRFLWYSLIAQWDGKTRKTRGSGTMRGVRIIPFMPSLIQFKDVHWDAMEHELGEDGEWGFLRAKFDRSRGQVKFPGGSWIKPFPSAAQHTIRGKGPRCDVIAADEADGTDPESYDAVAAPWLTEPWSLGIQLLTGTPERGRYGLLYREYNRGKLGDSVRAGTAPKDIDSELARAVADCFTVHATHVDYPELVSPRVVAAERAKAIESGRLATFEREWECNFDAGEGLVYSVFDPDIHIAEPGKDLVFSELIVCGDKGYTDPGVLLLCGVEGHGRDARLWVLREIYVPGKRQEWWAKRAREWVEEFGRLKLYHDPSAPDLVDEYKQQGLAPRETSNSIIEGIAAVVNMMAIRQVERDDGTVVKETRFQVSPKCQNLIRELGLYRHKKRKDGTFDETPIDKHNHACDSLRYGIFNHLRRNSGRSGQELASYENR